jgi:WD40 repeat protein
MHHILASIGDDNNLYIWDYGSKELLLFKEFSARPLICKFSPDGQFLAIGFINGVLMVYEPKVSKTTGEYAYEVDLSNVKVLHDNDVKQAIL